MNAIDFLNNDVFGVVLRGVPYKTILIVSSVNRRWNMLCNKSDLWKFLIQRDFSDLRDSLFDQNSKSFKQIYKELTFLRRYRFNKNIQLLNVEEDLRHHGMRFCLNTKSMQIIIANPCYNE
jgi:hypothetical protein